MLESLSDKFRKVLKDVRGHGTLSESNVQDALKEVRLALLEADVNYRVVKDFVSRLKEKAMGREVLESLTPGQQFTKIVHDELSELLGGEDSALELKGSPSVVMLVGLQGSGKTTTAAKLALQLKKKGRNPYIVPADLQRPAAVMQLQKLASEIKVDCFGSENYTSPPDICAEALRVAGRILDMGDILTLVEKAQTTLDEKETIELQKKLKKDAFTLDDFLGHLKQINKMGSLENILSMIPGFAAMKKTKEINVDEREITRIEAIISSMTKKERHDPSILNSSRRQRIARGSGTKVQDVNKFIKQYCEMKKLMKKMKKAGPRAFLGKLQNFQN